jgi:glycosyltransferase involved in cell wall biosynthesis
MRVGLDLLYLLPGETGGRESYARELVPALLEASPQLELVAFVNRDAGPTLARELNVADSVVVPVSPRSRPQWALGELVHLPLAARRANLDVLHSLANFAPAWGGFRRIVTIHDLHYRAVPELLSWQMRAGTAALVSVAARRAHRIIAVSVAGRDEIVGRLGIERGRIDVVPNGVRPPADSPATDGVRERYALGTGPIALAVATNLPHKNLPVLIEALASMPAKERPVLVIAGHGTDDGSLQARAATAGVAEDVRLLGSRSREELESLYVLADSLVIPSLHEGFGLPVLEAMARSLPVACSDIPALCEVAGAAALYFDPHAPVQIAARIRELIDSPGLASRLRAAGRERAERFSWSASAERTLASYRRALAQPA